MKKSLITLGLFLSVVSASTQYIRFEHTGGRAAIVSKTKLSGARQLSDLVPDVKKFYRPAVVLISAEVTGTIYGKTASSASKNDTLTAGQKNILSCADNGTEICIRISYKFQQSASLDGDPSPRTIEFALTPGPELEAEFPGGREQMAKFIEEQVAKQFADKKFMEDLPKASVSFVVDEEGRVTQPLIYRSTGKTEIDRAVISAIRSMPVWKPAEYSKGQKVRQKFIVSILEKPDPVQRTGGKGC